MFDDTRKRPIQEPIRSAVYSGDSGQPVDHFKCFDEEFAGVRIEIGRRPIADTLRECRFRDCVLRLQGSLGRTVVYLDRCVFEDCLIWPARRISLGTWKADFVGCKFKGRWSFRVDGRFDDCDLRDATIERLELMQSTGPDCQWPAFPHVIIRNIAENHADWANNPILNERRIVYGPARIQPQTLVLNLQKLFDDPDVAWEQLSAMPWASRVD